MTTRWSQRYEFYTKALLRLKAALYSFDTLSELEQDGVVQRFEFTFELAWKTLQDYFTEQGYTDAKGPRNVIKQAAQDGLIDDGYLWLDMLQHRNELNHTYDETKSRQILDNVVHSYLPLFENLEQRFAQLISQS